MSKFNTGKCTEAPDLAQTCCLSSSSSLYPAVVHKEIFTRKRKKKIVVNFLMNMTVTVHEGTKNWLGQFSFSSPILFIWDLKLTAMV